MRKQDTPRRGRMSRDVYSTIERVAEILRYAEVFPEAADLITDILMELTNTTRVWVDHPDLLRPFLRACAREYDVDEDFSQLRAACHFAALPAQIKKLKRDYGFAFDETTTEDEPRGEDEPPITGDAPAPVIHMAAWLDSHPRPIRNLLFAEKG